ncbi:hypothetical protein ACZ87_04086 [Candidatus Erwinia dacicola]|uniref:Uncharacterized protein n=1 Tax=Candidatus Erwinia dacicola TaxID=252393 RepID=A0A328TD99_9GAMM|nr:hypothetical protein ACZ87_04086 [Candidatus Erwinia dacicola]
MGSCAAPSTKQWYQFTIARSLQQCHYYRHTDHPAVLDG